MPFRSMVSLQASHFRGSRRENEDLDDFVVVSLTTRRRATFHSVSFYFAAVWFLLIHVFSVGRYFRGYFVCRLISQTLLVAVEVLRDFFRRGYVSG